MVLREIRYAFRVKCTTETAVLQIEKRLPSNDPNDCLAALLDPATKPFAEWLLGCDLCRDTKNLLRKKYIEAYMALKVKEGPDTDTVLEAHENVTDLNGTELEEHSKDEDIDGPSILLDQETNAEAEEDLVAEADKVFDT